MKHWQTARYILCGIMTFFEPPGEQEFFIEGRHIFATTDITMVCLWGRKGWKVEARGRGAEVRMYGHTHRLS